MNCGDPDGPTLAARRESARVAGFSQGSAYKVASEIVIEKAKRLAADMLEAHAEDIVFTGGTFTIAGTDRSVTMTAVIEKHAGRTRIRSIRLPSGRSR